VAELLEEIAAYETIKSELEARALGKWALIHNKYLVGTFNSFEESAKTAVGRFGRGPYLIRQIGAPPLTLPASVLYNPIHAEHDMRIR
jgi:hypothetical protein